MDRVIAPRKLIETALPLDAINTACVREKSIRHGHPSTLHLWWARRPLAAARAVQFAQLVNDPGWNIGPDSSKTLDNLKAQSDFATLMEEVVLHFTAKGHDVVMKVDIEARASKGFEETTVRTVKTNGDALKFDSNEFFKD
jgi:putative DNA methylase